MAAKTVQDFSGKVALITGSNSGIGEAVALTLARRGASVTLCGRDVGRLENTLEKCVKESGGHSERFITVSGDLNQQQARIDVVEKTIKQFGRLDVLICNAGQTDPRMDIRNSTEESFDFFINIFLKSVFFLIQSALPHLEKSKGNIITTSSIASTISCPNVVVYSMVKAAIDHMTRCLALDLAPRGIRVNAVNPSFVMTRIIRHGTEEEAAHLMALQENVERPHQPLGNGLLTLREVADTFAFLASDSGSFITWQTLVVDGGRCLTGGLDHPHVFELREKEMTSE